jgi:hypothetical protein
MVHSGFEASAVIDAFSSPRGMLAMIRALVFGPRAPRPSPLPLPAAPSAAAETLPQRGLETDASPEALRAAFAYRGDVTLALDDGSALEGYVADASERALRVWPRDGGAERVIDAARVRRVTLSGRDPAASSHERTPDPASGAGASPAA